MDDDEVLLRGRVYGTDHDDPDPGRRPGREYRELVGGPLDGIRLDVTGGRAHYESRPTDPRRWDWAGDTP